MGTSTYLYSEYLELRFKQSNARQLPTVPPGCEGMRLPPAVAMDVNTV